MRRRIEMQNRPVLAGTERSRLMMLVVLLMLVGALMYRARDPRLWSMFGGDDRGARLVETANTHPVIPAASKSASPNVSLADTSGEPAAESAPNDPARPASAEALPATAEAPPAASPALDEDPEEQGALEEEMTAIADKTFLQPEEMFAYYRLLRWAMSQSAEQLQKKAIQDPRYGDFFERPDFFRGKLVEFQLRVRRALPHKDLEQDNLAGLNEVWELIGYNDTSGQNFYMCVTDKLPGKMNYGEQIVEDGRFVGYFLKLMRYEDAQGKNRAIPVFIGKFIWDPPIHQGADPEVQMKEFYWVLIAAGVLGLFLVGRWALRIMNPPAGRSGLRDDPSLQMLRRRQEMAKNSDEESIDIETWLSQTDEEGGPTAIISDDDDESEEDRR